MNGDGFLEFLVSLVHGYEIRCSFGSCIAQYSVLGHWLDAETSRLR